MFRSMDTGEEKQETSGGHDGFVSSGDELEPEPVNVEDAVEMVVVDADALVSVLVSDSKGLWNCFKTR